MYLLNVPIGTQVILSPVKCSKFQYHAFEKNEKYRYMLDGIAY